MDHPAERLVHTVEEPGGSGVSRTTAYECARTGSCHRSARPSIVVPRRRDRGAAGRRQQRSPVRRFLRAAIGVPADPPAARTALRGTARTGGARKRHWRKRPVEALAPGRRSLDSWEPIGRK